MSSSSRMELTGAAENTVLLPDCPARPQERARSNDLAGVDAMAALACRSALSVAIA